MVSVYPYRRGFIISQFVLEFCVRVRKKGVQFCVLPEMPDLNFWLGLGNPASNFAAYSS